MLFRLLFSFSNCRTKVKVGISDWDKLAKRQPAAAAIPKRQIKRQCLNYQIFMRRKPPYYRWIMVNDGNDSKTTLFYCRFLAPICPKTTVSFKDPYSWGTFRTLLSCPVPWSTRPRLPGQVDVIKFLGKIQVAGENEVSIPFNTKYCFYSKIPRCNIREEWQCSLEVFFPLPFDIDRENAFSH